jgi:lipopolysaccharide heptosyltransferase I
MRILLVRTSALGDIVHGLPILRALRRHFPAAKIGWVVDEIFAPLLSGHRDLDQVLPVALRRWGRHPLGAGSARDATQGLAAIRRFGADVAVDLMGNFKAGALAWLSGAPRRIGHTRSERREPASAMFINQAVSSPALHAVDRGLALLSAFGLPAEPVDFGGDLLLPAEDSAASELFRDALRSVVLIQPGAGWGNKRYPTAWWGEVAQQLAAAAEVDVRVLSARGEESLARDVVTASRGAALHWHAPTLEALVAVLRRASLVLGGDTGPIHLAHALGRAVLCLCGPTDPRRNGPYGAPGRALAVELPCSYCHRRFEDTKACLLSLPTSLVATRALALLPA